MSTATWKRPLHCTPWAGLAVSLIDATQTAQQIIDDTVAAFFAIGQRMGGVAAAHAFKETPRQANAAPHRVREPRPTATDAAIWWTPGLMEPTVVTTGAFTFHNTPRLAHTTEKDAHDCLVATDHPNHCRRIFGCA